MAQSQCDVAKEPRRWGTGRGGDGIGSSPGSSPEFSGVLQSLRLRFPLNLLRIPQEEEEEEGEEEVTELGNSG